MIIDMDLSSYAFAFPASGLPLAYIKEYLYICHFSAPVSLSLFSQDRGELPFTYVQHMVANCR